MSIKRPDFSGHVLHAMNRGVDRRTLFHSDEQYNDFRRLLSEAIYRHKLRILEWVLMPNHWHMLLWPETKDQVSDFMRWLNAMHARSLRQMTDTVGNGAVYQSRYKAFAVSPGRHLDRLRNYLAMNPVKARLVQHSTDWRWGSAKRAKFDNLVSSIPLSLGPEPHNKNIKCLLSEPLVFTDNQTKLLKQSLTSGSPYGDGVWVDKFDS